MVALGGGAVSYERGTPVVPYYPCGAARDRVVSVHGASQHGAAPASRRGSTVFNQSALLLLLYYSQA